MLHCLPSISSLGKNFIEIWHQAWNVFSNKSNAYETVYCRCFPSCLGVKSCTLTARVGKCLISSKYICLVLEDCMFLCSMFSSHKKKHISYMFLIARFMGPTWGPSGADRTQVGPMLAPWILLSGVIGLEGAGSFLSADTSPPHLQPMWIPLEMLIIHWDFLGLCHGTAGNDIFPYRSFWNMPDVSNTSCLNIKHRMILMPHGTQ